MRSRTKVSSYGGVYPIPIYTKPAECGGRCIYCPKTPNIPVSYIPNADTRFAQQCDYDPVKQFDRFASRFQWLGGSAIPLEIIILGGSFSALDAQYRTAFISNLYRHLDCTQTAGGPKFLVSIATVESRPNQINQTECDLLRGLGISKVEIGLQHVDDGVLDVIRRGHSHRDSLTATRLLKENGFKVGYHVMLGLPGANYDNDHEMLSKTLWEPELLPDFLKIYPCELLRMREYQPALWGLYESGKWKPPSRAYVRRLITSCIGYVPQSVRISRIMRQFDEKDVMLPRPRIRHTELGQRCRCIRCREAGKVDCPCEDRGPNNLTVEEYGYANDICVQITKDDVLIALARIYRRDGEAYLLRELRVYGQARHLGTQGQWQGNGIGTRLLDYVENYVQVRGAKYLLVNAAIGARLFFSQRGYVLNRAGYLEKEVYLSAAGDGARNFSRCVYAVVSTY